MKSSRRDFVKGVGGIFLAFVSPSLGDSRSPQVKTRSSKARILVLFDPTFPAIDALQVDRTMLAEAFDDFETRIVSPAELDDALNFTEVDLFVSAHGSAFPARSIDGLLRFLRGGGNWLNLGGTPLAVPVHGKGKDWLQSSRETVYHRLLGITQSFPVAVSQNAVVRSNSEYMDIKLDREFTFTSPFSLYYKLTSNRDFPDEDGSAGTRDAIVRPLCWLVSKEDLKMVAPVVEVDRMLGDFAGGRWIFVTSGGLATKAGLNALAHRAIQGAVDFHSQPVMAAFEGVEAPQIEIQIRMPKGNLTEMLDGECKIEVVDEKGNPVGEGSGRLRGADTFMSSFVTPSFRTPLNSGLYRVRASQNLKSQSPAWNLRLAATTGFWLNGGKLLEGGSSYSTDATYLRRDGKAYPVTGTTYMGSDVHRKFLFEPNPGRWDEDFRSMKEAGINMVRTGIWTGWRNMMLDPGQANFAVLRSIDAFILTARKYEIPVLFTFFAFLPESWGGENAYLDPRSRSAQKEFISSIVSRYREANDVLWDLINEPSFCNPKHLWSCRPNYDRFESEAWSAWVDKRISEAVSDEERIALSEQFDVGGGKKAGLPSERDFEDVNILDSRMSMKALEYRLFAQDMFRAWAQEMREAISKSARPTQLVTVGQDEAGTNDSPNNQFFGDVLDFTSIHNWWLNDDLVWDSVITKIPGKPNLVEETGVMFYERSDGSALRTEDEVRNLLERKLAVALGTGSAGFIEWIWNTNPYMKSDNEAAIGLIRADGSVKPEFDSVRRFAGFFRENSHRMVNRRPSEVLLVIPHAHMFSPRNFATPATQRSVRVLAEEFSLIPDAVSDRRLDSIQSTPRLIVLPYPNYLFSKAWRKLQELVENGATLLVSGPIDQDEVGRPIAAAESFGPKFGRRPVSELERIKIEDDVVEAYFRNLKGQRIERAFDPSGNDGHIRVFKKGKGSIVWSMVPVEVSDEDDSTKAFYRFGLKKAQVSSSVSVEPPRPPVMILPVEFDDAILISAISETDEAAEVALNLSSSRQRMKFTTQAGRVSLLFVDKTSSRILSSLQ